jgi:hypothetical protein
MLSSNIQCETIKYFLNLVQSWNPGVRPSYFVTDCDQAQIGTLEAVFPQTPIVLCRWHVLRAVQSHFRTDQFPELWDLVKKMVRTSDLAEFLDIWDKISHDPAIPQSFIDYFNSKWIPTVHMWSAVARKSRNIWEECDTNMLLEGLVYSVLSAE